MSEANEAKKKALQLTLDKLDKTYGRGAVMKLGDEAVEEIANKKKNITNSFLKLIKETAIDCNINNLGMENVKCYHFGKYHTEYSFLPDINLQPSNL